MRSSNYGARATTNRYRIRLHTPAPDIDHLNVRACVAQKYYVVLHVLHNSVDLAAGIVWTEDVQGDATAALTGKTQLIRSNARVTCDAGDIVELVHIARMAIDAANFPFVGPTQFWMREDIAVITSDNQPISSAGSVTIQVSANTSHCPRR